MGMDLNGALLGIEKRLGSLGLPAGPDNVINHKALLGLFFGALGAFIGWLITEPYNENFSFWRDFLILSVVGFMICFLIMLTEAVFERTFNAVVKAAIASILSAIFIIAPSVLLTKYLFTSEKSIPKLSREIEAPVKIFVLDISGSMQGKPLDELKKAVHAYVRIIERNDSEKRARVACVVFSDNSRIISEPTNDFRRFLNEIDSIKANGNTNMAAGLSSAEEIIGKLIAAEKLGTTSGPLWAKETFRPSYEVIMVSDGEPNIPSPEKKAVEAVMQRLSFFSANHCPVNTVGAGKQYKRPLLEDISNRTGGTFVAADDVAKLVPVFEKLASQGLTQAGPNQDQKIGFTARVTGWIVIGIMIGICAALPRKSQRAIILGAIGGFVGGLVGSVMFELILHILSWGGGGSGVLGRCLGFVVLGGSIGFSVPIVESVGKTFWIRIIEGGQSGRIAVLDKALVTLGSGSNVDIRITDDPAIQAKHIRFTRAGEDQDIESLGKEGFFVNGKRAQKARITHEDTVLVGNTQFIYLNKLTGFGIQRGGFEKLDLSNFK
jgi:Mg-chelatase subunit ChlD